MQRTLVFVISVFFALSTMAGERVPADHWLRYADPADAGFDPVKLAAAKEKWQAMDSSAFMIVADGAVVAAWGEVERRFMCHSVRKSFMSGLYGVYWDQGNLERQFSPSYPAASATASTLTAEVGDQAVVSPLSKPVGFAMEAL
jgi:hypothetical protein